MNIRIINDVISVFDEYGEMIRFDEERFVEALSDEAPDLVDEAYLIVEGMRLHVFDALIFDEDRDYRGYVDYLMNVNGFCEDDALFMVSMLVTLIDELAISFTIPQIDELLIEALNQKSLDHLFVLGKIYFEGFGVAQDYEKAFALMKDLYNQGDYRGAYYLGYMYENGYGVEQDVEKAFLYYENNQDELCLLRLGKYYLMQNDDEKAMLYLSLCHSQEGYYYYGCLLEKQHLYAEAFYAFYQGARLYDGDCLYKVGMLMFLGLGTPPQRKEAYHYFLQGYYCLNRDCAYQLSMMLFDGIECPKDMKKALVYLKQAALLKSQAACLKLAYFYSHGLYVEKSLNKAKEYYQQARAIEEL